MKTKIIGILVCMLLIVTVLPAVGAMTEKESPTSFELGGNSLNHQNTPRSSMSNNRGGMFIQLPYLANTTPVNQEPTGLFGWVFLRGMVFNPREDGSRINARAINLHYIEISPQGLRGGVVRLKTVSFRNGLFIKMSEKGLFGNVVRVSGFCHGGIEIQ